MTAIAPSNGTGQLPVVPPPSTARRRRVLELAALKRRARRRATWISAEALESRLIALPVEALIAGGFAIATVTLASVAWLVIL